MLYTLIVLHTLTQLFCIYYFTLCTVHCVSENTSFHLRGFDQELSIYSNFWHIYFSDSRPPYLLATTLEIKEHKNSYL